MSKNAKDSQDVLGKVSLEEKYKVFDISLKNPEKYKQLKQAIQKNNFYCPCKISKTADDRCMCKDFREMDAEGSCHCGMYYKEARSTNEILKYREVRNFDNEIRRNRSREKEEGTDNE